MKWINKMSKFLEKKKERINDYNCIMIYLKFSNWDKIQELISESDLYIDPNDPSYGREDEPHVTLIYGIHDIPDSDIEDDIKNIKCPEIKLKGVSNFTSDNFDVLKFDVDSNDMIDLNKFFKDKYPNTNSFEYHPHCTIAYLKPGESNKYFDKIDINQTFKTSKIVYSKIDGSKRVFNLKINI